MLMGRADPALGRCTYPRVDWRKNLCCFLVYEYSTTKRNYRWPQSTLTIHLCSSWSLVKLGQDVVLARNGFVPLCNLGPQYWVCCVDPRG